MSHQPIKINDPIYWVYGSSDYQSAKKVAEERQGVHIVRNGKHQVLQSLNDLLGTDEFIENYGDELSKRKRGYIPVGSQEHGKVWVRFVQDSEGYVDFDFVAKSNWEYPYPDEEAIWYYLTTPVQCLLNWYFGVNKNVTERYLDDPIERDFVEFIQRFPLGGDYWNGVWTNAVVIGWACELRTRKLEVVVEFNKKKNGGVTLDERIVCAEVPPIRAEGGHNLLSPVFP